MENSAPDSVMVTVCQVIQQPIADAGVDQIVPDLSTVNLDGTASYDPDELDMITYFGQHLLKLL